MQQNIVFGDPAINMQRIRQGFAEANLAAGQVVILPEMWNTGYDLARLARIADKEGAATQEFLSELACAYHVHIIGGSVARRADNTYYNTTYCVDTSGKTVGYYDKVHLFSLMNEDQHFTAGEHSIVVPIEGFRVAPLICYDLRFPEWFRTIALEQVDVFVVTAQWPSSRISQWRQLIQARAVENQAYVIGVNRAGHDPNNIFSGGSLAVDPNGSIIMELGQAEEHGRITASMDEITAAREHITVLADRRPNLYS